MARNIAMEPERWKRIEDLYHAALDRDESARTAFLQESCHGEDDLRREVESLLYYGQRADSFIETPALELAAKSFANQDADGRVMLGRRIGQYELVAKLGSGGMGEVYRGVRADDQFHKEVAIKLIRQGYDTALIVRRFRNERQILASLEHPNIAVLLDGGTTEDGLPFFVMELVEGQPIDQYCAAHKLDVRERLKLFRSVCDAVQYAHQNLIVHRDLKPQNILVTAEGVPKLLDFGIGKILSVSPQQAGGDPTVTLLPIMTPDYASPEQVRNEAITTATDVYSLGAILYLLLTGRRPYRVNTNSLNEIVNAICSTDPEKPSIAVTQRNEPSTRHVLGSNVAPRTSARHRHAATGLPGRSIPQDAAPGSSVSHTSYSNELLPPQAEKLGRALSGDLDNIVLKALRKEPIHRYASVEQLSADIRRHLEGRPVNAASGTLQYRARKFVKRHQAPVAAAILIAIGLIVGATAIIREERIARFQQQRAERRFQDVRALANSLMFDVHDAIKDLPGATRARKLLVERALHYLDSLASDEGNDVSLQKELATAYEKVGDVQGDPHSANLGDSTGALASYKKALTIRQSVERGDHSEDAEQFLAADYHRLGLVSYSRGDCPGALEYFRQAFTIKERVLTSSPESQESLAGEYFSMGQCQNVTADFHGALESYRKSAKMRETIVFNSPELQGNVQTRLAGTYGYMAGTFLSLGDLDQAIAMQTKSMAILKSLSAADPGNATYNHYICESYYWTGYYQQKKNDLPAALGNFQQALSGFQRISAADPAEVRAKGYVGYCYTHIGSVQSALGHSAEAMVSLQKGLEVAEEMHRSDNSGTYITLPDIVDAYDAIGVAYAREAEQPHLSRAERIDRWKQARSAYQSGLNNLLEAKRLGASDATLHGKDQRLAGEIAKCDAKLAELTALADHWKRVWPSVDNHGSPVI
jgi:serine/threonine protein kinase/tetratricopeptide (TPR) repeat protein